MLAMLAGLAIGLAGSVPPSALAQQRQQSDDAGAKLLAKRIAVQIARLRARKFEKREAAEQALRAIGAPALPALNRALAALTKRPNPDLKWRLEDIIAEIKRRTAKEPTPEPPPAERANPGEPPVPPDPRPRQTPQVPPAPATPAQPAPAYSPTNPGPNLALNGDFETDDGSGAPANWQRPDGLTMFWDTTTRNGKTTRAMRFDTDVLLKEFKARQKEMKETPIPPAKPKTPVPDRMKYSTVAGTYGAAFFSDPIAVLSGRTYRLTAWVKGQAKGDFVPKVFVKGYAKRVSFVGERDRVVYKVYLNCRGVNGTWQKFTQDIHPTRITRDVKMIKIMLFPYWPRGEYWFDDVSFQDVGPDPTPNAGRPTKERPAPGVKPETPAPVPGTVEEEPLDDDELDLDRPKNKPAPKNKPGKP